MGRESKRNSVYHQGSFFFFFFLLHSHTCHVHLSNHLCPQVPVSFIRCRKMFDEQQCRTSLHRMCLRKEMYQFSQISSFFSFFGNLQDILSISSLTKLRVPGLLARRNHLRVGTSLSKQKLCSRQAQSKVSNDPWTERPNNSLHV